MTHETKDYVSKLRARGYRVTMQRLIVLDAVCALGGHATIAAIQSEVAELDPSIDRSTVYRALAVLIEVGLVVRADLAGVGKVYSIPSNTTHHHLVCLSCGKIFTVDRNAIQPLVQQFRASHNFELQTDHLVFNGFCGECVNSTSE
nr:transcriptional repressor [Anaerolineae bacterium]